MHIEHRSTPSGRQAYLRGTLVAVRHIAAFLQAGYTVEEIVRRGLPHLPPAAIHEAIVYYYDHQDEIEAELAASTEEAVHEQLRQLVIAHICTSQPPGGDHTRLVNERSSGHLPEVLPLWVNTSAAGIDPRTVCTGDGTVRVSNPRFLLDEHVWGGLVQVGQRLSGMCFHLSLHSRVRMTS